MLSVWYTVVVLCTLCVQHLVSAVLPCSSFIWEFMSEMMFLILQLIYYCYGNMLSIAVLCVLCEQCFDLVVVISCYSQFIG